MARRDSKTNQAVAVMPGGRIVTIRGRQDSYQNRVTVVTYEGWEKECRVMAGTETTFKIDYDGHFFFSDTLSTFEETYGELDDIVIFLRYWLDWHHSKYEYFTEKAYPM